MPSGTPGIPQGAGGTTSGPAMGGTSAGAAASGNAPKDRMAGETPVGGDAARAGAVGTAPTKSPAAAAGATSAAAPAAPGPSPAPQASAAQQAAARAQEEKQALAASMDEVTRRWRADAAKNGWQAHPPTAIEAVAGISASNAQDHTRASMPPPVRSEKEGTAPPSEDVKKPKEPGAK